MNPIYKFELSAGDDTRRVFPGYKDDLAIEYALEQNQEFYRGKLSGKLTFRKDDYSFINSSAFETEFELHISISYDAGQTWALYWVGRFWKTDCEFNDDDKTIVVQPDVYDKYNDVLARMENEYNLIELTPEIERVQIDKRPMIQIYVPGDTVIACFLSGMYWEQDCEAVTNETKLIDKYYFDKCASQRVIDLSGATTPELPAMFNGDVPGSIQSPMEFTSGDYKFTFRYTGSSGASTAYWKIIRVSDNLEMWNYGIINRIPPTAPYTVTLQPVSGTGATGTVELYIHDINVYGRYITDSTTVASLPTYPIPSDDMAENNRNYSRVIGYAFSDVIYFSSKITSTPTKWGIFQPGQYYQEPYLYWSPTLFPVAKSAWSRLSIWFAFSSSDWTVEKAGRQTYTLKDAYPLASVISVLLAKIAPGISHEATAEYSQFLYGKNPITGTDYQLLITQKSNILAGNYDQPAQKAPITLKYITDMLRDCFRCYWFIDDQNRFRVEHIQYFRNGGSYSGEPLVGIDLTQQQVSRNGKKWAFATSKYTFDKSEMPARYQFGWMDDVTQPFEGYPIDIISKYITPGNIEEINVSNFTSDVDYMLLNPSACSNNGFALLAAVPKNEISETQLQLNPRYVKWIDCPADWRGRTLKITAKTSAGTARMYNFAGETSKLQSGLITTSTATVSLVVEADTTNFGFVGNTDNAVITVYAVDAGNIVLPYIQIEESILQNGFLSFGYLQQYYMYDLPAYQYEINGQQDYAAGIKKLKSQTLKFPVYTDPNLTCLIKTNMGNGVIEKISINLSSRNANATLKYDTEEI